MARRIHQTPLPDGADALLSIGQAAALLNVSKISLRRWTDSGRLPCVRIGAKRERRFRRADLAAFPEPPAAEAAATPLAENRARVDLEGIAVDYAKHLCALYETDQGRAKMAAPFLADGLRQGDICYLVAKAASRNQLLALLRKRGCGVDQALRSGQFIILDGFTSADESFEYFEQAFLDNTCAGHKAIRVVGDMAWIFEQGMDFDDLKKFEIAYNHELAHRYPVVSLCLYDVREFSGRDVLGALKCHEDTFEYPLARFLGP